MRGGFNIGVCSMLFKGYLVRGGCQYRNVLPCYSEVNW